MKDFKKVGEAYEVYFNSQWFAAMQTLGYILIGVLTLCVLVYCFLAIKHQPSRYRKSLIGKSAVALGGCILILVAFKNYTTPTTTNVQDYKGRFEIVQNEVEKADSDKSGQTIVLKDKQGNQQKIEINSGDGSFQKGKYADVTVRAVEGKEKPTLANPIDSGNFEVKKIKQVEP